jgi:predicted ATPase
VEGAPETQVDGRTGRAVDVGFLAAYGSFRGPVDARDAGNVDVDADGVRPHLLFADAALRSIEDWMSDLRRSDEATVLLDALLPDDVRCLDAPDTEGRVFAQRDIPLRVTDLSDGIQSFLAWMGDLLCRLDDATDGRLVDVAGVVLVDEIDQRMHPQWQRTFLTRLGSTFPALQFICTAHSPLLPSGLERENLLLVEPDPDLAAEGATRTQRLRHEDVYGRTADQVLESSYFGLASSRSEPFWQELREIADRARSRTTGQEAALEFMRRLADPDLRRRDRG